MKLRNHLNEKFEDDRVHQDKKLMKKILDITNYIDFSIDVALDVCYEILTDVNAHTEARMIEREFEKIRKRIGR
jgi:hypothetical protein